MIFKKKPKFKFYSSVPGVVEQYPILSTKEVRHLWIKKALEIYKKRTSNLSSYGPQCVSAAKCPGIKDLGNLGWTVTTWFDLIIETNGKNQFAWKVPATFPQSLQQITNYVKEPIKVIDLTHLENQVPVPPYSLDLLVKISMPWSVEIPKGWNLLMVPINYSDDTRFQCSSGILRSGNFVEVNPQIFWNVLYGQELIKAGTPLCQLIPIPDQSFDIEHHCLNITEEETARKNSFYFRKGCTFLRNPNVV